MLKILYISEFTELKYIIFIVSSLEEQNIWDGMRPDVGEMHQTDGSFLMN